MKLHHAVVAFLFSLGSLLSSSAAGPLELQPGDHICLVGSAVADRMQHDGWLETYIYAKFPKHDLVFRNIARAGDEVGRAALPG